MDERLKVGIAGYGVVGKRRRIYVDQHSALRTVAVCDQIFDEAGMLKNGVRYYTNYRELIKHEDLDILLVCMSNDMAAEVTIAGLEAGLHVFCEKPPGRNLAEISRVRKCEARHPGLKLKYGFNHRYHESVRDAQAIIESKELGNIINLRGVYGKSKMLTYGQNLDWRTKRYIAGGGILLDQGIHMVDLMRLFAGEFVDVHSYVTNSHWGHDVEDNAYALMRTADGKVAFLHSSATQWRHRFQLDITLELGAIILSGILSGSKSYGAETMTVVWAADDDRGDPKEQTTRYVNDPSWEAEIAEFAEVVLEDKPIVSGSSAEAFESMRLVYRIYCADTTWRDRWSLCDTVDIEDPINMSGEE